MTQIPGRPAIAADRIARNLPVRWELDPRPGTGAPNVLQIVFDDTGWSDFGCFGSPIATPNIDALAAGGLRYTNFHVTPLCSPTRACLHTGRNHHNVGMRFLAALDTGFDNSRGRVDPAIPMVPARLRERGYGTYLVGKWHLAPKHHTTPAGPFTHWPLARGYDRFYGFMDGCTDQYLPELVQDNSTLGHSLAPGEHLTTRLADQVERLLADHVAFRAEVPFYLTFAPGATHAPLQAPLELIEKFVPLFEAGWDAERERRLARQIALGVAPEGTRLTERNPGVPAWAELSEDERRLYIRQQAAYAAFLEHTDAEIGRILAQLDRLGLRDDTLILLFSDNGASREGMRHGAVDIHANYSGQPEPLQSQIARIDRIGLADGPAHYPEGWAMASNTPFRRYKQLVDLGGVRSPLVVNWPARIPDPGAIRRDFVHVIDLAATVAGLAGATADDMDGRSIADSFDGPGRFTPRHAQYWEMFGHRALWLDGWKAVTEHETGAPYEADVWRLYDTTTDFSESTDCAAAHPERLDAMIHAWMAQAEANGVFPLDDRPMKLLLNEVTSPQHMTARESLTFYPEMSHVTFSTGLAHVFRPMSLRARLDGRAPGQGGLLVSCGGGHSGYLLYLDGDRLVFEHAALDQARRIEAPVPPALREAGFDVTIAEGVRQITLVSDGRPLTSAPLPEAMRHLSFWGLDIGRLRVPPISEAPAAARRLPEGVLHSVTLRYPAKEAPLENARILERED